MKTFHDLEELRDAVGSHLGRSDWYELDQERVNAFADATDDHQWIHNDVDRARKGAFGATVAHGYLVLSLIPVLCWQVFKIGGLAMEVNYGLNKVRFPAPALIPNRIRASVDLLSVEPTGPSHLATMRVTIEAEGQGKPLCVAETIGYLVPA
jgi:acyl dehydratase